MTTPTPPEYVTDPDTALAQGFFGFTVDPTPNANYGVKGGPTPETDTTTYEAAKAQREAIQRELSARGNETVTPSEPPPEGGA